METNTSVQISEEERSYWCKHAFRVLPRQLWLQMNSDFGEWTLVLGANLAVFSGVHFHNCEITLNSGLKTTVLTFTFKESPEVVFCLLPEEIMVMEMIPPTAIDPVKVTIGFVPHPELGDDCGIAYESVENAAQLAKLVGMNGSIKITLCGTNLGLLAYLSQLQAWKREREEECAAASVAAAAAAAAVESKQPVHAQQISAAGAVTQMSGSLPTLRPRGMEIEEELVKTESEAVKGHVRQPSQEQESMKDEDSNLPTSTSGPAEQEPAGDGQQSLDNSIDDVINPVPVMPSLSSGLMPGLESLVKAASIMAPSPFTPPLLFSVPQQTTKPESPGKTITSGQVQPSPPQALRQHFSPFSGITPGLRTPDLDEEAVAVLQRGALQKRRKSNSEKPIPFAVGVGGSSDVSSTAPMQQSTLRVTSAVGPERKAGRFKIPPEQRHKRSSSQGHGSGGHSSSQNGGSGNGGSVGGGLSSFCGTQDTGGTQGLHQCKWDGCSLTFGVLSVLTTHLQSHTLASSDFVCRWEGCPRQGKPFSNHSGLFRHLRYHTGDKPCKCPVEGCGFSSVDNGELNRHIKLVHRG